MLSQVQKRASIVLKLIVIASAVLGTIISAYAGRDTFMGGRVVFMYFTIQSNLAIAAICAVGLFLFGKERTIPDAWYLIKYTGTVSITLTGIVFSFILAPTLGDEAWNLQNVLTHVVVPAAAVIDFFTVGINGNIKKRSVLWVTLPPLLYAIYAGIGYIRGWRFARDTNYPYFFLNWGSPAGAFGFSGELPFMGCVWWILAILIFLIAVGYLYLWLVDFLKERCGRE